ncbi:MAG: 4Fe-4S dicluster domain-containing protein [Deltaproteobacteria bacterium]|nr:MAG: 4Fe-4S dicluster domain-containing protein [Deltaproteobacteria bacterium]
MAHQKIDSEPTKGSPEQPEGNGGDGIQKYDLGSPEESRGAEDVNFGFVINNKTCIGCHACSTACKSENEVPLGVYRTWVKYTEVGVHPHSRRQFQVTRCNHCANPPCVRICPVTAMYQRDDGIVEFDPNVCIGCKACMQACPYDAIHIDPNSGTAAKCHYCSHRVDIGLEPACVVVCPTHSIIAGDINDPKSEISKVLSKEQVTVRKPSQGTVPKLYYIEGADTTMHPTATVREPETFLWADVMREVGSKKFMDEGHQSASIPGGRSNSGDPIRAPRTQGVPDEGPIHVGRATAAEHMVQVAYNAQHKVPWHWPVPAYLVTKGLSSGIFMILAVAWLMGWAPVDTKTAIFGGFASLAFVGLTTLLLVIDLERPERFLSILLRPQWKSWLTRGAVLLIGFSTIAGLWWAAEAASYMDWLAPGMVDQLRPVALWVGLPFALGAAIYTAFLFGQAEGRDLWQSSLLPFHLLVQALMMGGAALLILHLFAPLSPELLKVTKIVFGSMLVLDLFVTLMGEFGMSHASEWAAKAAHEISHGKYATMFWYGSVALGHIVPLVLLWFGAPMLAAAGGVASIIGLYCFEHAFVMAPQEIPNS